MPITWSQADISPATLAQSTETAFSWGEFSVAYELYKLRGRSRRYDEAYSDLFKDRTKKKKVVELIMKVKSNKIKQKVEIPMDTKIALSDIDMVIQEVLQKPTVNIHVS